METLIEEDEFDEFDKFDVSQIKFSVPSKAGVSFACDYRSSIQTVDFEAMVPGDRHTTVWMWLQMKAVQLGQQKIITSDIHVQTICNAVTLICEKANDLMSVIDRDQPFPYTSICGILVNFNLLLTALWKGVVSCFVNVLIEFSLSSLFASLSHMNNTY
jgi:hypothetical protein